MSDWKKIYKAASKSNDLKRYLKYCWNRLFINIKSPNYFGSTILCVLYLFFLSPFIYLFVKMKIVLKLRPNFKFKLQWKFTDRLSLYTMIHIYLLLSSLLHFSNSWAILVLVWLTNFTILKTLSLTVKQKQTQFLCKAWLSCNTLGLFCFWHLCFLPRSRWPIKNTRLHKNSWTIKLMKESKKGTKHKRRSTCYTDNYGKEIRINLTVREWLRRWVGFVFRKWIYSNLLLPRSFISSIASLKGFYCLYYFCGNINKQLHDK